MKPDTLAALGYHAAALLGRLPWSWLRALGDLMAWAWRKADARESQVTRRNLEIAYPDLLPSQREDLHRAILRTTARQALETLRFWTRPPAENLAHLRERLVLAFGDDVQLTLQSLSPHGVAATIDFPAREPPP